MPFSHGVVVCHINFRGAAKRTFYTVLSVRKRCSWLHRKDMRQSVPVFASQMVEIREILWVWKRKVIRQTTARPLVRIATWRDLDGYWCQRPREWWENFANDNPG